MRKKRFFLVLLLLVTAGILLTIYLCDKTVINSAKGKLYADPKTIPFNKVGLLLGTSKSGPNGHKNLYYEYRIQAAIMLIKEHKIKYLIISGDNSRKNYNEPASMR